MIYGNNLSCGLKMWCFGFISTVNRMFKCKLISSSTVKGQTWWFYFKSGQRVYNFAWNWNALKSKFLKFWRCFYSYNAHTFNLSSLTLNQINECHHNASKRSVINILESLLTPNNVFLDYCQFTLSLNFISIAKFILCIIH